VRIWQGLLFSKPMPLPSGSDVKNAQKAKPLLELDDERLELLELDEDELDEDDELGAIELTTVTGSVLLLPPPPPPQPASAPMTHPANTKLKRDLFEFIFILLK
jgi:hypothetical protein